MEVTSYIDMQQHTFRILNPFNKRIAEIMGIENFINWL